MSPFERVTGRVVWKWLHAAVEPIAKTNATIFGCMGEPAGEGHRRRGQRRKRWHRELPRDPTPRGGRHLPEPARDLRLRLHEMRLRRGTSLVLRPHRHRRHGWCWHGRHRHGWQRHGRHRHGWGKWMPLGQRIRRVQGDGPELRGKRRVRDEVLLREHRHHLPKRHDVHVRDQSEWRDLQCQQRMSQRLLQRPLQQRFWLPRR